MSLAELCLSMCFLLSNFVLIKIGTDYIGYLRKVANTRQTKLIKYKDRHGLHWVTSTKWLMQVKATTISFIIFSLFIVLPNFSFTTSETTWYTYRHGIYKLSNDLGKISGKYLNPIECATPHKNQSQPQTPPEPPPQETPQTQPRRQPQGPTHCPNPKLEQLSGKKALNPSRWLEPGPKIISTLLYDVS